MMKLGEAAYSAEGGAEPASDQAADETSDEVVDAEFEEIDDEDDDDIKKANQPLLAEGHAHSILCRDIMHMAVLFSDFSQMK